MKPRKSQRRSRATARRIRRRHPTLAPACPTAALDPKRSRVLAERMRKSLPRFVSAPNGPRCLRLCGSSPSLAVRFRRWLVSVHNHICCRGSTRGGGALSSIFLTTTATHESESTVHEPPLSDGDCEVASWRCLFPQSISRTVHCCCCSWLSLLVRVDRKYPSSAKLYVVRYETRTLQQPLMQDAHMAWLTRRERVTTTTTTATAASVRAAVAVSLCPRGWPPHAQSGGVRLQ